ncbi:tetratricopeptide repeat protein [Rhodotorula paludigena]|uniref:tetratricopeptide repeat protein n=1 Tax=Rhodotorula paludigena TaxID=86838 RepID=UPI0031808037
MSARPPLPFGLGRDPQCAPHRCLSPDTPLPAPGSPLHDQVAAALSQLFQTFFATSLRYLGVSEILDWLESSGTVDAWILTGLEQGRLPDDIANDKNLEFGKEAFRQVVKGALQGENEAWATSLRETGFSSAVSMVYEGLVAQLKPSKAAPLPCLHTLLTPTGLSMLKSAPLKSAFPVCPPRTPPSPAPLLASIRSLIQSGALTGDVWKSTATWRAQIRKAFAAYHALLRTLADELVSERSFALEFYIFLENISQPLQLLQLIADDFEAEFGPGATRGLLGVGDAGGDNLLSVMDFCAARKPSELLARVRQRVAEKHEREKRAKRIDELRAELKELDLHIRRLLLEYRSTTGGTGAASGGQDGHEGGGEGEGAAEAPPATQVPAHPLDEVETARLQGELEAALDARDAVKLQLEELQVLEDSDDRKRQKDKVEKDKLLAAAGLAETVGEAPAAVQQPEGSREEGFKLGSSKDLLSATSGATTGGTPCDPFSTVAPRAVSPLPGSAKGKARATNPPVKSRPAARYAPPPPQHRYNRGSQQAPAPQRALSPSTRLAAAVSSPPDAQTSTTPSSSRASSPVPVPALPRRRKRASAAISPSPSAASSRSRRMGGSRSRAATAALAQEGEEHCEMCCPTCRAEEEARKGQQEEQEEQEERADEPAAEPRAAIPPEASSASSVASGEAGEPATARLLDQAESEQASVGMPLAEKTNVANASSAVEHAGAGGPTGGAGGGKKKKKKRKGAAANASADGAPLPADGTSVAPPPLKEGFTPLSRHPPPKCCPPHRCTGVGANYEVWAELDGLLYETCLAGFKYELIGALPSPLFLLRDKLAKSFLLGGGRMTTDSGEPKEMDSFLAIAEERGLWHAVNHPEIQAWSQRVLAISLQKLVDVLRATLGEICICKLSQHIDILREARHRLQLCEQADRQVPIDLPEMDPQAFMKWCHVQLRAKKIAGPEWEGVNRQYIVQDYLLSFSDAFDAAMDRLMLEDPFILSEDMCTLLEWQGGIRALETALRFGRQNIVTEFGTGAELLEGKEEGPPERRPLQAWGRLLELSAEARTKGIAFSRDLAEQEKQRGNDYFAADEHEKAIISFTTASIIFPAEPTFPSNCAAARMKVGTPAQYAEAVCDCTLALFEDPRNIKALYRRGTALAMIGQWKAAFVDLKYLERIAPDCQPAKEALAWATERYNAVNRLKVGK